VPRDIPVSLTRNGPLIAAVEEAYLSSSSPSLEAPAAGVHSTVSGRPAHDRPSHQPLVTAAVVAASSDRRQPGGRPYLLGTQDQIITPAAQLAMAQNAGSTITRVKAGHLSLVSRPGAVTRLIEQAARATG
jgi:hypothetical protein